jgi:hypothetical protein
MTDLRAEATRIGYWNEGLGNWADTREDAHIDDCD